ncbi:hypothetical protein [Halomicrococcus sp. SG-WS-1]|uniref:hypothetical protein n=1 Tax=Halomicrococcus sp. SG-WS-1 TaxID=3439057 RepID=UPI003F79CDB1
MHETGFDANGGVPTAAPLARSTERWYRDVESSVLYRLVGVVEPPNVEVVVRRSNR